MPGVPGVSVPGISGGVLPPWPEPGLVLVPDAVALVIVISVPSIVAVYVPSDVSAVDEYIRKDAEYGRASSISVVFPEVTLNTEPAAIEADEAFMSPGIPGWLELFISPGIPDWLEPFMSPGIPGCDDPGMVPEVLPDPGQGHRVPAESARPQASLHRHCAGAAP